MKAFFKLKQINPRENALLTVNLFDPLLTPILVYVCEVWGPSHFEKLVKVTLNSFVTHFMLKR